MMRIEHEYMLWCLALLPLLLLLFWWHARWRKQALQKLGESALQERLMPNYSSSRRFWKNILLLCAVFFLIVGLMNPQIGSKEVEIKREGIELAIALDVSNSMLAEDLSPNRLERSKRALLQLIDQLKGDRVSVIVFGGQAYVQLPMTTDYAAAKLFISSISTGMIPTQGTAIGAAIDLCQESFNPNSKAKKAIIVITDGENHEDNAIASAESAYESGIMVHTIGVGSEQGAPLPIVRQGRIVGYRNGPDGQPVTSKINENMLQEIAAAGHGLYVRATNANAGLDFILEELSKLDKTEFNSKMFADYEDQFQYFLGMAICLLLMEFLIPDRVNRQSKWISWLNKNNI